MRPVKLTYLQAQYGGRGFKSDELRQTKDILSENRFVHNSRHLKKKFFFSKFIHMLMLIDIQIETKN